MENILTSIQSENLSKVVKKYPNRLIDVLNCFNTNQYKSKMWLVDMLNQYPYDFKNKSKEYVDICILGGWYGLLGHLLLENYNKEFDIRKITSIDVDPLAKNVGKSFTDVIKFKTLNIKDMDSEYNSHSTFINTSCEHMKQSLIYDSISKMKKRSLVVLQSNNYIQIQEHINCVWSLEKFVEQYDECLEKKQVFELHIPKEDYTRFMIIGVKR